MALSRRKFGLAALTSLAFSGMSRRALASESYRNEAPGYGLLQPDPAGLLDLPQGFSYHVVSRFGDRMDDGLNDPDGFDGMGCFPAGASKVALVRNH